MKPFDKAVLGGWLLCDAFRSLYQDLLGKDAYIKLIDAGWMSWIDNAEFRRSEPQARDRLERQVSTFY